jgi:hypothetical protein
MKLWFDLASGGLTRYHVVESTRRAFLRKRSKESGEVDAVDLGATLADTAKVWNEMNNTQPLQPQPKEDVACNEEETDVVTGATCDSIKLSAPQMLYLTRNHVNFKC